MLPFVHKFTFASSQYTKRKNQKNFLQFLLILGASEYVDRHIQFSIFLTIFILKYWCMLIGWNKNTLTFSYISPSTKWLQKSLPDSTCLIFRFNYFCWGYKCDCYFIYGVLKTTHKWIWRKWKHEYRMNNWKIVMVFTIFFFSIKLSGQMLKQTNHLNTMHSFQKCWTFHSKHT